MAIIVNLDVMMAKRKMSLTELSEKVDITVANLSILKTGKASEEGVAYTPMESFVPAIVIVVTFLSMFVCDILERKCNQKWLSSFSLGLSMVVGMASAVLFNYLATLG